MLIPSVRWAKRVSRKNSRYRTLRSASFSRERSGKARDVTRGDDWRDALRTTARTFIARRRRLPRGSNSRPGEHEQRRVRVDLAPIAHRAHRFVPAHRCAPPQLPQLRRGGQARSPGDARRRRGRGARHRRRAADQGGPRGLPALGMQAQGAVEVRARPSSIRDPRRGLGLFRPLRSRSRDAFPVASFRKRDPAALFSNR